MSDIMSVLLGWLIGEIVYFAIIGTIGYIEHRKFSKLIKSIPPWIPDEGVKKDE